MKHSITPTQKTEQATIQVCLRLQGELAEALMEQAQQEERSYAYVARNLIKQAITTRASK